jgi:hypothetical protein
MTIPSDLDERIRKRAAEILGGESEYQKIADHESKEVLGRWNLDTELIGRILRAHLFLERFVTENLQRANPWLGSVEKAKLSFSQKIDLLNPDHPDVADVTPGIRKLNSIRNRLAHQSGAELTAEDAAALLQCRTFSGALRMRLGKGVDDLKPIEVLEQFARHASIALSVGHSRLIAAVAAATKELAPEQ